MGFYTVPLCMCICFCKTSFSEALKHILKHRGVNNAGHVLNTQHQQLPILCHSSCLLFLHCGFLWHLKTKIPDVTSLCLQIIQQIFLSQWFSTRGSLHSTPTPRDIGNIWGYSGSYSWEMKVAVGVAGIWQ